MAKMVDIPINLARLCSIPHPPPDEVIISRFGLFVYLFYFLDDCTAKQNVLPEKQITKANKVISVVMVCRMTTLSLFWQ